ncbi:MAG TPA: hypothetical protein VMT73_04970 [Anaerolineales bacterium]|nr:hypothetical protein [Anaerolineales bacterium]
MRGSFGELLPLYKSLPRAATRFLLNSKGASSRETEAAAGGGRSESSS